MKKRVLIGEKRSLGQEFEVNRNYDYVSLHSITRTGGSGSWVDVEIEFVNDKKNSNTQPVILSCAYRGGQTTNLKLPPNTIKRIAVVQGTVDASVIWECWDE